jgi:hypothetical protein
MGAGMAMRGKKYGQALQEGSEILSDTRTAATEGLDASIQQLWVSQGPDQASRRFSRHALIEERLSRYGRK